MSDVPALISIDYSDSLTKTFLKIYPGFVEIRKPKYERASKFNTVKRVVGIQKEIYSLFPISDIERVEIVAEATQHRSGIIQFFLKNHDQNKANFFNLVFRTDAIQYWYKDREVVNLIISFIHAVIKLQNGQSPTEEEIRTFVLLTKNLH